VPGVGFWVLGRIKSGAGVGFWKKMAGRFALLIAGQLVG